YASNMDIELLSNIGLTPQQAKTYAFLAKQGAGPPPAIAQALGESRTNTYNVLEKLLEFGLVKRFRQNKRYVFQAEPPTALEKLAKQRRDAALQQERQLHALMPDMLSQYFDGNERPGVRFFQGESELKDIYMDQIKTRRPIYIIRPDYNMDLYDFEYMSEIRHMARKAGIKRYAITPDRPKAPKNYRESDPFMKLTRTWIKAGDYTTPVEWNAYGDKLAIMSFGKEAIGMIIESPQIAEAFRQLYGLLDQGLKRAPGYSSLPREATYIGATK
ncbi:MAG TPA: helix-turn-helix domain-containing protein, partial [Candidatus Dormibacteraeota bacterium]|nr:helix-turn-helix domain-containing protein [Candidatus Dormibacteraeota bacterium]